MNRKPCFDEKCIKCIQSIVKKQLSDCNMMDISMCIHGNLNVTGDVEIDGDLTVNGKVYYETLDVSNTCIDNLHLGTIYLQSNCDTMIGDAGTTGHVLTSQGGKDNTWINPKELIGTLDEVLQKGHTSYSTNIDMGNNMIENVVLDTLNLDCSLNVALDITTTHLILPIIVKGHTYYIELFKKS
jgi:hypothetical protein